MPDISAIRSTPNAFGSTPAHLLQKSAQTSVGFGALSPEKVQEINQKVFALLADAATLAHTGDANTSKADANRPDLRQADLPRLMQAARATGTPQQRMTPEAVLMMLGMMLKEHLSDENSRSLAAQLELVKQRLAARESSAAELAEAIRLAQAVVDAAMGEAGVAEGELNAALEALKKAEAEVARLEQALADAPEEEKEAIRAQLEAARAQVVTRQADVNVAHAKYNEILLTLNTAMADLEHFKQLADNLDPNQSVSARGDEKALTNQAFLSEVLGKLQGLMDKANVEKLKADMEFARAALKAREEENLRRSAEYQEELRKAEDAQKKMGCIGKIVGWVVTVVAVVAAPFTGGASMALAGIGLALAIGEEFGLDIMGKVLEPIMKVLMEAVKAMSGVIGDVLTAIGIPADVVDKIKDALAIIAVAAAVVAVFLLSKKAASTIAQQAITKAVTKAVTKAISEALPQILKTVASTIKSSADDFAKLITKGVSKATSSSADDLAHWGARAGQAAQFTQVGNQAAQGIGAVVVADMYKQVAEIMADIELALLDSKIFRELIETILNYFLQTGNLVNEMFKHASDLHNELDKTSSYITHHIGTTAKA